MRVAASTMAIFLALAAPVAAQGPTQDGYTLEGPAVLDSTDSGDSGPAATGSDTGAEGGDSTAQPGAGFLPFTGADLIPLLGLGAGLLGMGVAMRRLTRPPERLSS